MANLTQEQFQLLLETVTKTALTAATAARTQEEETATKLNLRRNNPAALGPMRQCMLGDDKMRKLTIFDDWLEEAENRMSYIGTDTDTEKIILLRTWGGQDINEIIKRQDSIIGKSTKIKKEDASSGVEMPKLEDDTATVGSYKETVEAIRETLRRNVNRTMAMHQLMSTKQGSMPWNCFVRELEIKANILNLANKPYTMDEAVKDAAIFGMNDGTMRERALAEDPSVETLSRWCQARESGREDAHNLKTPGQVKKLDTGTISDEDLDEEEIDNMIDSLQIMKMKRAGKYSARHRNLQDFPPCNRCNTSHEVRRCPANGKECYTCGEQNHFTGSKICSGARKPKDNANKTPRTGRYDNDTHRHNPPNETAKRIVKIKKLSEEHHKWVEIAINGVSRNLFTDTGSDYTIIPPEIYDPKMGKIHMPDICLRAWGATDNLKIVGMIQPLLVTKRGAKTRSKIYIVEGYEAEPLLGDLDAEELGFITFNKEGREPNQEEASAIRALGPSIPQKLRDNLNVDVETKPKISMSGSISMEGREKINKLVNRYKGSVFDDSRIGLMKIPPIHLDYDTNFQPKQPTFRNIPAHYQERVSDLLRFLREQGVITDIDPRKSYDCVMNVVITDKAQGQIRMNIDNTPRNPGLKRTKFHVQTPQEIRHELKEAKIFTEMDMGWAYHQVPIDEETRETTIFQTHEGLHRMERLYFGPTASSGLFHNEVRKTFLGLNRVTNVHDNILVYSSDEATHLEDLELALARCMEAGITLKLSKSTFAMPMIKWFGRTFTSNGVTADMGKVEGIIEEGRPKDIEEVRSLLMACQYNAKFAFDNGNLGSYEDITLPLRKMLKKDAVYVWDDTTEEAYRNLVEILCNPSTLQAFDKSRETHIVADASETGIQASLYQVTTLKQRRKPTWVPVDHVSRALTATESRYSPIERESLGLSWGIEQFRFYVVGSHFSAWTDHEPLPSIYNNRQKPTSKRIAKHRDTIQDLDFKVGYLRGTDMPCDYGSRHPNPIVHLSSEEQDLLGFDNGREIYVRKIINLDNSPNYVRQEQIEMAAEHDLEYQLMKEALGKGVTKAPRNSPYKNVWSQLTVVDRLVYKGDIIVIPDASDQPGATNIRTKMLDIAHEGHPGQTVMKRFLRAHVWFPQMDADVTSIVQGCLQCQAATETKHRDPLISTNPPPRVWEHVDADHWGPTDDGVYLLVVIDETSKYPEVEVVKGTGAEANIDAFDSIFARHGYPSRLKSDGGPPFNGGENHLLQKYFRWAGIDHKTTRSADDPEANGLAESFMKHVKKVWHTALMERNNPVAEMNKHLQMFRATPHPSTGYPPAQLLFGRNINTRLPHPREEENALVEKALVNDAQAKATQKKYKDAKPYVKHHRMNIGDQVLLKQQQSKRNPPYDPEPYTVVDINGHQITADRDHQVLTRDAQKWKPINIREKPDYALENVHDSSVHDQEGSLQPTNEVEPEGSMSPQPATSDSDSNAGQLVEREQRISSRSTKGQIPVRYGINN